MTPPPRPAQNTDQLLELLHDAGAEFVIIGGVAAIIHGATTMTRDLDIAAPMTPENIGRIMDALRPYHPKHATRPDLGEIQDSIERLSGFRLLLLDTDLGRLDVLKEVEAVGPVSAIESEEFELLDGKRFRVMTLDQLITVKRALGRPKDKIVAMELLAVRERLR